FEIPAEVLKALRAIGAKGASSREAWEMRLKKSPHREDFQAAFRGNNIDPAIAALGLPVSKVAAENTALATHYASRAAINVMWEQLPELLGGSADLTQTNNTLAKDATDFTPEARGGRYIRYGIPEHGMASAMNGMALHGGIVPYGGT